ncbi:Receptor-like serine/threonine-protein kinase [Hibiscus syriacus]|uniref:non-specific serine/threonine protein kinase n=1 Tax=Hibiscus syriacus TaxID=106335 RepID=A0A6A2XUF9_HIBSY|nr:Receptor-like serine/threonine-protein kinase [Hibiscus syriacus]
MEKKMKGGRSLVETPTYILVSLITVLVFVFYLVESSIYTFVKVGIELNSGFSSGKVWGMFGNSGFSSGKVWDFPSSRSKGQRSAPELKQERKSEGFSGNDRFTKSTCSVSLASPRSIPELYEAKAPNLRVFSFSELKQATRDFNLQLKIGEGGFGSVYKGTIKPADGNGDEPLVVAIKQLNKNGLQGHKQWVAEVQFLGVVEHPNLVKLIGYCAADGERGIQLLLVYEFMQNKSLEDHLFRRVFAPLSWETRLQIILGAAQGLAYLHEGLEVQIIYRDLKASNVLLDEKFNPKLSDFGLAREGPMAGRTHVSTAVVGTYGYAAPDYIETGHLTDKSDVWSFGVVLYEILSGRRSLERGRPKAEEKLLEWVKQFPADSKKFSLIMDPRLGNQYSLGAAREIAKLADACLVKGQKQRPKMSEVVERLKQIIQVSEGGIASKSESPLEASEIQASETEENSNNRALESWKRRMAHLAKLGEHADGASRRRLIMLQRAKVPALH